MKIVFNSKSETWAWWPTRYYAVKSDEDYVTWHKEPSLASNFNKIEADIVINLYEKVVFEVISE